jgi:phage pi2 protein 07
MQKFPISIQTFSQIIKDNYIYVDKTKFEELIQKAYENWNFIIF